MSSTQDARAEEDNLLLCFPVSFDETWPLRDRSEPFHPGRSNPRSHRRGRRLNLQREPGRDKGNVDFQVPHREPILSPGTTVHAILGIYIRTYYHCYVLRK